MPMYPIHLKEQLDQCWSAWLGGLTVTTEARGNASHGRGRRPGGTTWSTR
jgi:hypothetical protein